MKPNARIFRDKGALVAELIGVEDRVLDIGFYGQGITSDDEHSAHANLKKRAREVWGIDIDYDDAAVDNPAHYRRASAESFSLGERFDIVFAGDLIEHLSNVGMFLDSVKAHLAPGGRLIITTPNAFNLFNLTEKLTKPEPTVNPDHTCYFNSKTLRVLLKKNGWKVDQIAYLYTLGELHRESWKKKALNALYVFLSRRTSKFVETLVIVASPI